ncbi:hypothetical protein DS832_06915 [Bombilactobacillus bombi]|uniref:Uncharacterized protein n=1 Tax=Bombilactobacillus bombi TaxID=1303590 RepID=A0A3R6YIX7_9LACO|nr:hypothetical protein [Bombilactobacillus bombi]RHW46074.1 hypothetical protein DS832_06915 [Bombilactobacillus bombi]
MMVNDLTKLAKDFSILNHKSIKSVKTKDKILLPDDNGQVDLSNLAPTDNHDDDSNISGGGTIPDSGMNTDPGKSLSGVEQLWIGPASIASPTDVTLSKAISDVGDGIQLAVQIIKTPITNGQLEATVTLPAVASVDAKPQDGKYVCSVPIPISILAKNLAVGKTINVALDGIGEALSTTKVSQSPVISIYVKDNKTLTITNHQGYALDKTTSGNMGAFYDGQITSVNSYTKVQPVPQLPNGTILFSGAAKSGEIKLAGVNDSFNNVGDGIAIYFNSKTLYVDNNHKYHTLIEDIFTFSNPLLIAKADLLADKQLELKMKAHEISTGLACHVWSDDSSNKTIDFGVGNTIIAPIQKEANIKITNSSFIFSNVNLMTSLANGTDLFTDFALEIDKVTTYTN